MALKVNKTVLIIVKIVVSSVLLYIVFRKTGLGEVAAALREVSIPAFFSAVALYIFAQFISTVRWKLLLPEGIGLRKLLSLCMIGSFFNTFLPGVIGGDAVKGLYLYRLTGKGSLSLASIFMDRYIGFAALIAICTVAFPFGFRFFAGSPVTWLLPVIVFSFIGASLLIFGLRLGQRIRALSEFYSYFHAYRNQTTVIGKTFFLSLIVQLAGIFSVYILSRRHGTADSFPCIFTLYPAYRFIYHDSPIYFGTRYQRERLRSLFRTCRCSTGGGHSAFVIVVYHCFFCESPGACRIYQI